MFYFSHFCLSDIKGHTAYFTMLLQKRKTTPERRFPSPEQH